MNFLTKISKSFALCFTIATSTSLAALCQTAEPATLQPDTIEMAAKPMVFAPETVSPQNGFAPSFTPDGNTVYFSGDSSIYFSKRVNNKWTKPKVANFSGHWNDMDPFISPDGKRLFFSSYRPLNGAPQDKPQTFAHIWFVDHLSGDKWSAPHHLEAPVNLEGINNYAPSVSRSGMLCFFSPRRDINNKGKSYYTKWKGDHYDEPRVLSLNGSNGVRDPFISPDERYLIFVSGNDLYISYHNGNEWLAGQKLGSQVNNGGHNYSPYVSPDGKMLYYSQDHTPGILMIPINLPPAAN
jgi:Tol biopolymer transport system component